MDQMQPRPADAAAPRLPASLGADGAPCGPAASAGAYSRLLGQLAQTASPAACQRIAHALLEHGNAEVTDALIAFACSTQGGRHEHLVLALRDYIDEVVDGLARCLAHREAGVRLAAVRLVEAIGLQPATGLLTTLLDREQDLEVCSAAVVALGKAGDHRALPVLRRLAQRFRDQRLLAFDIDVAIGQIE